MRRSARLALGLACALVLSLLTFVKPALHVARASTDPNFLKASGPYLKTNSGMGSEFRTFQ